MGIGCCNDVTLADHGFSQPTAKPSYHPDLPLEPTHIKAHVTVTSMAKWSQQEVEIEVTTTALSRADGARTITLNAESFFSLTCKSDHKHTHRYDGSVVTVTFDDAVPEGQSRDFTLNYVVRKPLTGMFISHPDEAYPKRPTFIATDHETERARYWLACVDLPFVRTTVEFTLSYPKDNSLRSFANGMLQKSNTEGEVSTDVWLLGYKCPSYLLSIAIGKFEVVEDSKKGSGDQHIVYIAPEGVPRDVISKSFEETSEMMHWLSSTVRNPFPFPKYYQICLPCYPGAMENISFVTWNTLFLCNANLTRDWRWIMERINIHEMAHSYFGDAVVIRHFEHAWLKESWASFMECQWFRYKHGEDEFRYILHGKKTGYFGECETYVRPISTKTYDHSWNMFDRHLYPGGAMRLLMLQHILGPERFWKAVGRYIELFSQQVAETDDFRKCLERESGGKNLTPFFDQWIYGRGYPKLKGTCKWNAETRAATITMEQTQEDKEKGIRLFDFDVCVEVADSKGETQREILRFSGDKKVSSHTFSLPEGTSLRRVCVDPDAVRLFALDMNPGEDLLAHSLEDESGRVNVRIWAISELVKSAKSTALEIVKTHIENNEKFFGVRKEAMAALAKLKTGPALSVLAHLLRTEKDSRVIADTLQACGPIHDEALGDTLRSLLSRSDGGVQLDDGGIGLIAKKEILAGIGAQRNPQDLDLLRKFAFPASDGDTSFNHWVEKGAILGLSRTRSIEALALLKSKLSYGSAPEPVRVSVVNAFAQCAKWQGKSTRMDAADAISSLLRDDSQNVRLAAMSALGTMGASSYIGHVTAAKASIPVQYHPEVDAKIKSLRGSSDNSTKDLKDEISQLMKRLETVEKSTEAKKEGTTA